MSKQAVQVRCRGAGLLGLNEMQDFQGDLKILTAESEQKLRSVILRHGISEPVSVWKCKGKNYILNGHQRHRTLINMQKDGHKVPKIPVNFVDADSLKEAKEKVLALTSQYGELTFDGLKGFIDTNKIDLQFINSQLKFPEIDISNLIPKKVEFTVGPGSKEVSSEELGHGEVRCPRCKFTFDPKAPHGSVDPE